MDFLAVQGTLKSLLQHHSSKASVLRCSAFFTVQLSHPYMTSGKTIALTRRTCVGKVMSQLFNMPSRLIITPTIGFTGFPRWCSGKESACQCRRCKRHGFDPWVVKIPWRRKLQSPPVFFLGKFHGQRSLASCSPWGPRESDTAECTHTVDSPAFIKHLLCSWHLRALIRLGIDQPRVASLCMRGFCLAVKPSFQWIWSRE